MVNDPGTNGTVVVRLDGGLGNQMFQYAAALGLAVRQDRALKMEVSAFEACKKRSYQLAGPLHRSATVSACLQLDCRPRNSKDQAGRIQGERFA